MQPEFALRLKAEVKNMCFYFFPSKGIGSLEIPASVTLGCRLVKQKKKRNGKIRTRLLMFSLAKRQADDTENGNCLQIKSMFFSPLSCHFRHQEEVIDDSVT